MKIILIAAVDENMGIGLNNDLLYRFKPDLKRFKDLTSGHAVLMGRKTYESIGRPLPNRTNIVVSRNPDYDAPGCAVFEGIFEAVQHAKDIGSEILYVLGGEHVFAACLDMCECVKLTLFKKKLHADAHFPREIANRNKWDWKLDEAAGAEYGTDDGVMQVEFYDVTKIR